MLQKIDLIGNIVADAELKTGKDEREFISFRVAVNEGTGEDRKPTYYDVTYVKSGVVQYLKKARAYSFPEDSLSLRCPQG